MVKAILLFITTAQKKVMQRIGMNKIGEFNHPLIADGHWLKRHVVYGIRRTQ